MATIRASCPDCGDVEFTTHDVQVRVSAPDGSGTRVTWTNEGDMGANPVNRYFGLMMDSMVGPDFEAGLKNLKALAERD